MQLMDLSLELTVQTCCLLRQSDTFRSDTHTASLLITTVFYKFYVIRLGLSPYSIIYYANFTVLSHTSHMVEHAKIEQQRSGERGVASLNKSVDLCFRSAYARTARNL